MFDVHAAAQVAVIALVTAALRFLPFLIFGEKKKTPPFVAYLGQVLPYAIMGMLVVYFLKGVNFATAGGWLPALTATAAVILLHIWKRQTLISILGGTAIYMLLINLI